MDEELDLVDQVKQIIPQAQPQEIAGGISQLKAIKPDATPQDVVNVAQTLKQSVLPMNAPASRPSAPSEASYMPTPEEAAAPPPAPPQDTKEMIKKYLLRANDEKLNKAANAGTPWWVQALSLTPRGGRFASMASKQASEKSAAAKAEIAANMDHAKFLQNQSQHDDTFGIQKAQEGRAADKYGIEERERQDNNLINSDKARIYRHLLGKMSPEDKAFYSKSSAGLLEKVIPTAQSVSGQLSRENEHSLNRQAQSLSRMERQDKNKEGADLKQQKLDDTNLSKFGNQYQKSGVQDVMNVFSEAEGLLGGTIDSLDEKKADLPGVSVPGLGRVGVMGTQGARLQQTLAKLNNIVLKDRSGAAVTPPEWERFKQEMATGKFATEADFVAGLKRAKEGFMKAAQNIEAGYDPSVVDRYRDNGGKTSHDFSQSETVTISTPKGNKIVPRKDVQKYLDAGAKVVK